MKKIISIIFYLLIILLVFSTCNENPSSINEDDNYFSIIGTWKEVHLTRYDTSNTIIQDIDLDTVRISKLSLFNEKLQILYIDTLKDNFYFLLFEHYNFINDSIHYFPDSLLDIDSITHYWNAIDSSFTPDFPVLTSPFIAHISNVDNNNILETRKFPIQKLEISWKRISHKPVDLTLELFSINPKRVNKTKKEYYELNRVYSRKN